MKLKDQKAYNTKITHHVLKTRPWDDVCYVYCRRCLKKARTYNHVSKEDKLALTLLENILGEPVPLLYYFDYRQFGHIVKDKHVISLALNKCNLSHIPKPVLWLSSLKQLTLSQNHLTSISVDLSVLQDLTKLHLCLNKLHTLPESMGKLAALQKLCVAENALYELPSSFQFLTSLVKLDLLYNQFTEFPSHLPQSLTSLKFHTRPFIKIPLPWRRSNYFLIKKEMSNKSDMVDK